jgi:hypothetical protein
VAFVLIVEDGTIVPNANSYVTRADYIAYALRRGVAIDDAVPADVELTTGMDYVETQRFVGERVQTGLPRTQGFSDDWGYSDFYRPVPDLPVGPEQPCQWPRFGIYLNDDLDGAFRLIPQDLKRAQMQVALDVHNGFKPFVNTPAGPRVISEKVGPLSRTYADQPRTITLMPIAMALLRPLLVGGAFFGATTFRA